MAGTIADQLIGTVAQGTQNTGQNFKAGADLAQGIQQVQMQREQLEMQKEQLEMKKDDELANSFETMSKIKSPTMRKLYAEKVLGNKLKMLKREDMFSPVVLEAIQKGDQESLNRVINGINQVRTGQMDYATFRSSLTNEDDFVTLESYEPDFLKAQEAARDFQERKLVAATSNPNGRLSDQFDRREMAKLNSDVRAAFKPIEERKVSIRNAYDSLSAVKKSIAEGKKASSIDFNVAARGLAKAFNSGAMTDDDVNDFKRLAGVEDIREANIKKYLTGGAPKEAVEALLRIAERSASNLDKQAQTIGEGLKSRLSLFPDQDKALKTSGLDAYSSPTLKKVPSGKEDPKVADYAKQYNLDYGQALQVLTKRGYKPGAQ